MDVVLFFNKKDASKSIPNLSNSNRNSNSSNRNDYLHKFFKLEIVKMMNISVVDEK